MNELRCFGCMKLKKGRPECEHCGYDERRPNAPHQLQPGTVLQNQYVVGRVLGQGGFGITYMGWDSFLEIPVAIKEYYPSTVVTRNATVSSAVYLQDTKGTEQYTNNLKRFAKEARSLAKLGAEERLNNIVRVQNLVQANNTAYIIMEYVAGVDLREHIRLCGGALTVGQTLEILLPLIKALDKIHAHGIIHRDISPDNIMVLPDGSAKLIDFGASHLSQMDNYGNQKSTEAIVKHGFAPMEQYSRRGHLGPWTDVYAMCATVYYCLTGQVLPPVMDRSFYGEEIDWAIVKGLKNSQLQALKDGLTLDTASRIQSMALLHERLTAAEEPEIEEAPENEPESLSEPIVEPEAEAPQEAEEQPEVSAITATEPVQEEVYTTLLTPEEQENFGIAPTVAVEEAWAEPAAIAPTVPVEVLPVIEPTTPVEEDIPVIEPTTAVEEELPVPGEVPEEEIAPEEPAEEPEVSEEPEAEAEETDEVPEEVPEPETEETDEVLDAEPEEEPEQVIAEEPELPEVTEEDSSEIPEEEAEPEISEEEEPVEEPAVLEEPEEEIPGVVAEEPAEVIAEVLADEAAFPQPEPQSVSVAVEEAPVKAEPEAEPEIPAKAPEAKKKSNVKVWIAAAVAMLVCVVGIVLFAKKLEPQAEMAVPTTAPTVPATEETAPPTTEATKPAPTEPEIDPSLWLGNVLMDTYDGEEYDTYQHNVGKRIYRSQFMNFQIRAVYFLDTLAEEPADSWDVSAAKDGKVKAWAKKNGERYDLYIAAEGGINGTEACKRMFFGFAYMEEVDFGKAFHTDEATDMSNMFFECETLKELDLSSFRTGKVTNMGGMFAFCQSMTSLDVSSFDTANVTNMGRMFQTCIKLSYLDLTNFDTGKVTDMSSMFSTIYQLAVPMELDLSSFTVSAETNTEYMFSGCRITDVHHPELNNLLPEPAPDAWKDNVLMSTYGDADYSAGIQYRNLPVFGSDIRNDEIKSITFLDTLTEEPEDSWDVSAAQDGTVKAWVEKNGGLYDLFIAARGGINGAESCRKMFIQFANVVEICFGNAFHTETADTMELMFSGCSSLVRLDLSSLDTGMVTDMKSMFLGCKNLQELELGDWNTAGVTDMSGMFWGCESIPGLDLSNWNTAGVTDMQGMFYGCGSLMQLDISGWNTLHVTDMDSMFFDCHSLPKLDVSSMNTAAVENMHEMFAGCSRLAELDLQNFYTHNVSTMERMFAGCSSLQALNVRSFNTSNVWNMHEMFLDCSSLTTLDVRNFNTTRVTTMDYMFAGCSGLTSLDLSRFVLYKNPIQPSAIIKGMFEDCNLTDVNHPELNQLLG